MRNSENNNLTKLNDASSCSTDQYYIEVQNIAMPHQVNKINVLQEIQLLAAFLRTYKECFKMSLVNGTT